MAQIRERVKKNGKKTFLVRIRMKGKTEATASFERLTDARLWAQHTEIAIREGRYATTFEAQKHTVRDLVERYIRDVLPRKPKIQREYAHQLKWWEDQIGDVLLSDLSSSLILYKSLIIIDRKILIFCVKTIGFGLPVDPDENKIKKLLFGLNDFFFNFLFFKKL